MCARIGAGNEYSEHDGQTPCDGYDHPAAILTLRLTQDVRGNDAVSEEHQYGRADKFEQAFNKDFVHIGSGFRFA